MSRAVSSQLKKIKVSVIIPAAGLSKRMEGFNKRKPFILLGEKPIIAYILDIFKKINVVKEIILVVNKKDLNFAKKRFKRLNPQKPVKVVIGGAQRKDSCLRGLLAAREDSEFILIHDAARPFIKEDIINKAIAAAQRFGAAIVAVPATSTIKQADTRGFIRKTPPRKFLWIAQTPQIFRKDLIIEAFRKYKGPSTDVTDDAFLVEKLGHPVKIIMGAYDNIKISTPEDLIIAKQLVRKVARSERREKKNLSLYSPRSTALLCV